MNKLLTVAISCVLATASFTAFAIDLHGKLRPAQPYSPPGQKIKPIGAHVPTHQGKLEPVLYSKKQGK